MNSSIESSAAPTMRTQYAKAVLVGSVGNMIEWYDWFIYSTFAIYFAGQFFPEGDRTSQLLSTAAIFAVGFFAPPSVGGYSAGSATAKDARRGSASP